MFDFYQVLDRFRLMSKLPDEESSQYTEVVRLCIAEVEKKLKPGIVFEEHQALLTELAAANAYYRYMIMTNMVSGSINALDLTVSVDNSKQIQAAKRLQDELMIMAKDLLNDDIFLFGMM